MFTILSFGTISQMSIFKSIVNSDVSIAHDLKEIKIKRNDNYLLNIGSNVIVNFLGFKRHYSITYFDD